ncbi:hypothetical protein FGB62_58g049 [Gracilaria domingensis]|nr:hypothetical protein FGB62_58g049 [Gracilaria domingensis]
MRVVSNAGNSAAAASSVQARLGPRADSNVADARNDGVGPPVAKHAAGSQLHHRVRAGVDRVPARQGVHHVAGDQAAAAQLAGQRAGRAAGRGRAGQNRRAVRRRAGVLRRAGVVAGVWRHGGAVRRVACDGGRRVGRAADGVTLRRFRVARSDLGAAGVSVNFGPLTVVSASLARALPLVPRPLPTPVVVRATMSFKKVSSYTANYEANQSAEQAPVSEKVSSLATKFGKVVDPTAPIPLRSPRKVSHISRQKSAPNVVSSDESQRSVHSLASRFTQQQPSNEANGQFSTAAAAFRERERNMHADTSKVVGMVRGIDDGVKGETQKVASVARAFESSSVSARGPAIATATLPVRGQSEPAVKEAPLKEAPVKEATDVMTDEEERIARRSFGRAKSVQDTAKMFERGVSADSSTSKSAVDDDSASDQEAKNRFQDAAKKFGAS